MCGAVATVAAHRVAVVAELFGSGGEHVTGRGDRAARQTQRVAEDYGRLITHAHGLNRARTLAEWARARAYLGHGNAEHAAARLAPLVHAGPRQGHFGLWVMVVPCCIEGPRRPL